MNILIGVLFFLSHVFAIPWYHFSYFRVWKETVPHCVRCYFSLKPFRGVCGCSTYCNNFIASTRNACRATDLFSLPRIFFYIPYPQVTLFIRIIYSANNDVWPVEFDPNSGFLFISYVHVELIGAPEKTYTPIPVVRYGCNWLPKPTVTCQGYNCNKCARCRNRVSWSGFKACLTSRMSEFNHRKLRVPWRVCEFWCSTISWDWYITLVSTSIFPFGDIVSIWTFDCVCW